MPIRRPAVGIVSCFAGKIEISSDPHRKFMNVLVFGNRSTSCFA